MAGTLLCVDASIPRDRSASSAVADLLVGQITAAQPQIAVVRSRHGEDPLPATAWAAAGVGRHTPEADRVPAHREALELASRVATELQEATSPVLALSLYNYGVSQRAKTWIDPAIAGAPFGTPLLDGKPVVLVATRGGAYGPGGPRGGWDHNVDYVRRILVDTCNADLTLVERDVTLVSVNPGPRRFHRPHRPDAPDREPRSHGRGHRAHRSLRRLTAEPAKQR